MLACLAGLAGREPKAAAEAPAALVLRRGSRQAGEALLRLQGGGGRPFISPKASAALSRHTLQAVIREKAGITLKTLDAEIQAVIDSGSVPSWLADNLDAVRVVGNFAAHPMKSTNTGEVVEVEPGEASCWTCWRKPSTSGSSLPRRPPSNGPRSTRSSRRRGSPRSRRSPRSPGFLRLGPRRRILRA